MSNMQAHLTSYQNNINLPQELCVKPLALIGFCGLDTLNNAIHKSVWDTFNNRAEKAPILYKIIKNDHEFPVIKPKRNSYDWYIPKGILKRNWMSKHLFEIPSVMVIFYDLDWNDSLWNEKMIECASRVQSMRAALEGRDTRIIVVLIQNNLPIPEDPLAAERAVSLCSSCELNSQSLYILPHGHHLVGYTIRLENTFFEFAQNYYHNEAKIVKSHKEHLNKNSHQNLYVRHQFKIGFLYELKQDIHTAHKHYTYAYNNVSDIRIVDTNALEIRTVAGFINYKLCRLMFALNLPRDAISQFKAHIDRFKTRTGFQELSFEHYSWLSKQYEVFGDIFDEAVKLGLPAVQTQHPGIYYQQSAQYAIQRKISCHEHCSSVAVYPQPDPLEGIERMEFYGQRPWRPTKVSGEPPDPQVESSGINALQYLEKQINHSTLIIALYGQAISQYKIYKCPRTRRHLVLQMAEECFNSKDYGKALTLYLHMLSDYRQEKWWVIISEILGKAIKCAFLTANIQDYILFAIEILGSSVAAELEDKKRIYENLNRILKKQIPYGDPKLPYEDLQNAIILWQPVCKAEPLSFTLNMSKLYPCIETKARFTSSTYKIDQNISVEIFVRSLCPFPLTFFKVFVTVNTPNATAEFGITNMENVSLIFHNNEIKRFLVEFTPDSDDINKDIQIDSINLQIGNPNECSLNLRFTDLTNPVDFPELQHFKYTTHAVDFDNIKSMPSATIVPRNSKLDVKFEHAEPALVGEWYKINIVIKNEELCHIKDLEVEIGVLDEESQIFSVIFATEPFGKIRKLPLVLDVPKTLEIKTSTSTEIYLQANSIGISNIQVKITYMLDIEKPVVSIKNEFIALQIMHPFNVETKYLSGLMTEIQKFYADEEFGIVPTISFSSPWNIEIEETLLEFYPPVSSVQTDVKSQLKRKVFKKDEVGAELYLAVCDKASDQNVTIGKYTIKWKRENGVPISTQVTLSGYHCEWIPLDLKLITPAHGFVRTPMVVNYELKNRSSHLIQLDVGIEGSDAFMFAGYKQFGVSILPKSTKSLEYNLYPLIAGSVSLPKLVLSIPENAAEGPALRQDQLRLLLDRTLPTHLYVMPQAKGSPKLPACMEPRNITLVN